MAGFSKYLYVVLCQSCRKDSLPFDDIFLHQAPYKYFYSWKWIHVQSEYTGMYKCTLLFTVENEFMLNPTSDRRDKFATMKSMSTESRVSSESSGSQQKQVSFGIRPMGGSYSSGG